MALVAATTWEVRTTGSDNNGGGFVTGASGSDFSQQNGAQATLTTASTVHTTTTQINVAPGDYTVTANDVGNIFHITGGTATAGFYQITVADTINNRWTLDRSAGTSGQTVVGKMGGAMATPGAASAPCVAGNRMFIKRGTYPITSTTVNVANGKIGPIAGVVIIGYDTTRSFGNSDTGPTIQLNVASGVMFGTNILVYNVICDGNSTGALQNTVSTVYEQCIVKNFSTTSSGGGGAAFVGCEITANAAVALSPQVYLNCYVHANTVTQTIASGGVACNSIFASNTGATTDGLSSANQSAQIITCTFYGNGRDGLRIATNASVIGAQVVNCHAEGNTGNGYNLTGTGQLTLVSCGSYNNSARSASSGTINDLNPITLSGSAFTNAAGGDFSLNGTAGAGALLRGTGYVTPTSQTFLSGSTISYPDVGAAQHLIGNTTVVGGAWAFSG